MGWKVTFSPDAFDDLKQIVTYRAVDDPIAAENLGMLLLRRIAILEQFPELGSPFRRRKGVRAAQILFCKFGEFQTEGRFWLSMLR